MRLHPDRPHPRPAAAVRDAEGLVQVQVADVRAEVPRPRQPDQRVHVRPVEIDLPAVRVGDLADLAHRLLEDPVGRGIGDHAAGEPLARAASALARKSSRSTSPFSAAFTGTTFIPAICALAGLVPCAEVGIRQTSRCPSPRLACQARIVSSPAYSPCAPEFGCIEKAS